MKKYLVLVTEASADAGSIWAQSSKYEQPATAPYPLPFNPASANLRNAILQFFIGYKF